MLHPSLTHRLPDRRDEMFFEELEALMKHEFFRDPLDVIVKTPEKRYLYKPLAVKEAIRLVCIEPGGGADPLKGTLTHVLLNRNPRFDALSYVWGPPEKPYYFHLPEGRLPITESLYTALARLRQQRKTLLWIDALCINQEDDQEKVLQIMLMPRIYSSASCVLIWLGEDGDGKGGEGMQLLDRIGQADFTSAPFHQLSDEWAKANDLPVQGHPLWFTLLDFWRRPWFRRAWVVQEFLMAKNALIVCGTTEVQWKKFPSALEKMVEYNLVEWGTLTNLEMDTPKWVAFAGSTNMHIMIQLKLNSSFSLALSNLVRSYSERDPGGLKQLREGSLKGIPWIQDVVMMLRQIPDMTHMATDIMEQSMDMVLNMLGENPPLEEMSLINILTLFDNAEATDPRDKLFALLGISKDREDEELRPNYKEPIESVLLRYARAFVKKGDGLLVLYRAGSTWKEKDTPSWVPDWTDKGLLTKLPLVYGTVIGLAYAAASSLTPRLRLTHVREELIVSGSYLDSISRIIEMPSMTEDSLSAMDPMDYILAWKEFLAASDDMFLKLHSYVSGEPISEVQWRTMIANLSLRSEIAPDEFMEHYFDLRFLIDDLNSWKNILNLTKLPLYLERLVFFSSNYNLCQTEEGLVGLVPKKCITSDKVYLFAGSRAPFALRSHLGDEGRYELVGICYIHGMMNGEALDYKNWREEDICLT